MAYQIEVTKQEAEMIGFVGGRYSWSDVLGPYVTRAFDEAEEAGAIDPRAVTVKLAEHEAWEVREAFDADTEGGHGMFPMLSMRSELADKLMRFWDSVV